MEHDIKYKFKTTKDSIDYWIIKYIKYHNETTRPKEYFDNPIEFEVVNTPYTLRITPSIDTVNWFYPDDKDDSKGNVLLEYSKGDKGIAFAEKSDSSGRIWWYVIMDSKNINERKIKNRYEFKPDMKGWMSSRYLSKK